MNIPNTDFRVDLLFPSEYSDFIAEVYFRDEFVCLILQENGLALLELKFDEKSRLPLPLDGFKAALEYAEKRLIELREVKR
jgi:hypothetical protein